MSILGNTTRDEQTAFLRALESAGFIDNDVRHIAGHPSAAFVMRKAYVKPKRPPMSTETRKGLYDLARELDERHESQPDPNS